MDADIMTTGAQLEPRQDWLARVRIFLKETLEIDRSVIYLLLTRTWQILSYPITVVLIAKGLTPELQGFYYTFASLLALQVFVELGFVLVITNVTSHEWAHLGLNSAGRIVGAPDALSRLVSLGRLIFKWYAAASLLFVVGVGSVGWIFFSQNHYAGIAWQLPWLTLVFLSGLLLWALPFNALLEGCNQVETVNKFRLSQVLLESIVLWGILLLNGGLWITVAVVGIKLLRDLYLLFVQYRHFFKPFFVPPSGPKMDWRNEIWPMQWRLALAGMVTYFTYSLFNPVMFHYHGAIVAGQMGMTIQVASGLQLFGMAWVSTKVPRYGILIAQKDYAMLDHIWKRNSLISLIVVGAGVLVIWILIYCLNVLQIPLAERLLDPLSTALLLSAAVFLQSGQCLVAYLRAHKEEPILAPNIVMALVAGLLVWQLGSRFGPVGAAAGYLGQMVVNIIWIAVIWWKCRDEWHKN